MYVYVYEYLHNVEYSSQSIQNWADKDRNLNYLEKESDFLF